jgi:hypothetical protein
VLNTVRLHLLLTEVNATAVQRKAYMYAARGFMAWSAGGPGSLARSSRTARAGVNNLRFLFILVVC